MAMRELSWLAFSQRILQEAQDQSVPLYERIKFLSIFSSNLDEYFRVRVASLRSLFSLRKKSRKKLGFDPEGLIEEIRKIVDRQQNDFGTILRTQILPQLRSHGVFLVREDELEPQQQEFVKRYFEETVAPLLAPVFIGENKAAPHLHDRGLYFAAKLLPRVGSELRTEPRETENEDEGEYKYAIVEIPVRRLPRFAHLPGSKEGSTILFLDDVIRLSLPEVFPHHDVISAFAIKLTRDAELHLGDEYDGNMLDKIKRGLEERRNGVPCRFLYDASMPGSFLKRLRKTFALSKQDLIAGGRYHNLSDLMALPNSGNPALSYPPLPPLHHGELESYSSMFAAIRVKDVLLVYPYQSYDYVLRFLREAAADSSVASIQITLYRVAKQSVIVKTLLEAAARGVSVTAFVELKARFDEESNVHWVEELEKGGVRVLYSFPGLKVHAKICLVERRQGDGTARFVYLGTGNFNENTARMYVDYGLFSADERLTSEVQQVFEILAGTRKRPQAEHLLIAPFNMRERFLGLIDREIKHARAGHSACIIAKMNGLEDAEMIEKLYEASIEGVKVSLIVRGVCCLNPQIRRISDNITAISIIDRFLEHGRVYIFHNNGDEQYYLASADWMTRNLSRRIEVAFPIYDGELRTEIRKTVDLQLRDTMKARIISRNGSNTYRKSESPGTVHSQVAIYNHLRHRVGEPRSW